MTRIVVLGLVVMLAGNAAADDTLTLEQAVASAIANNASLRAARAGSAEADAGVSQARSAFFPRVTFSEAWQRGNQPVFVFSSLLSARRFAPDNFAIDALNHPEAIGFFRASAGFEQVLFDGGRRRAALTIATATRDIADARATEAAALIEVATTRAFARVVAAEASARALQSAQAAAREDLARAERRRDAGLATDADVLSVAVHVADLRQREIQAAGDHAIATAELNRLMGAPVERLYQVALPPDLAPVPDQTDLTALFAEAERNRPELKRAASGEQVSAASRRAARSAFVPSIAGQALVDLAGTRFSDRASAWTVGAEIRWNLSIGGAERAALRAAAAASERARAEHDDVRAAIHVDVVTAVQQSASARARLDASAAAIAQARESQRIIRDRFDAGIAGVNDVLRASSAFIEAEAAHTGAIADALVSAAALRRALGRGMAGAK